jgi:DNA-binding NtrC family response regulator
MAVFSPVVKRVLVVDDSEDIREFLVEALNERGHQACGEASAETAEAHLERAAFDVLLTDVGLPGISGLELAERALRRAPQLRVILATGLPKEALERSHPEIVERAILLVKPYDEDAIVKAVEDA